MESFSYKEQIIDIYSNQKLVRVPLSQNKDFKTIKNAIIKAAANLSISSMMEFTMRFPFVLK